MKVLIKGGLIGGIIAFIWMNISWMVLPWHAMTIDTVEDDTQIAHSIKANMGNMTLVLVDKNTLNIPFGLHFSRQDYAGLFV